MASYVVPQVEIHQLFSEIPIALATKQVPFIFGPNYLLHRYSEADEKVDTYVCEYNSETDGTKYRILEYPKALDPEKVDMSYTKLIGDNVVIGLFQITEEDISRVWNYGDTSSSGDDELIVDKLDLTVDADLAEEILIGRHLRLDFGNSAKHDYRDVEILDLEIVGVVLGESSDSSASSSEEEEINRYVIRVQINEELESDESPNALDVCEVQSGVEFPRERLNDPVKAAFQWKEDVNNQKVPVVKITSDLIAQVRDSDFAETSRETPWTKAGWSKVLYASLYITYRELITSQADTIHSLTNASEVANALGAVHPDNPLAQAVYNAALNAGGQIIRYMAIPTEDLSVNKNASTQRQSGYSTVLNAATLTREVYFLVPVTRDAAVLDMVQAHVNSMSAPTSKRWRIAFVSAEIPERDTVYSHLNNTDGDIFRARVKRFDPITKLVDVEFVIKSGDDWIPDPDTYFTKDLKVDDILVTKFDNIEWNKIVPQEYRITKIVNKYTVRVSDPNKELVYKEWKPNTHYIEGQKVSHVDDKGVGTDYICITEHTSASTFTEAEKLNWNSSLAGEKAEVVHPYTNAQKADVIKNLSSSFADRRMYNVFPSIFANAGITQTGEMAAACVAGLVSSCLPQQPITNLELNGIDDIPLVYQTFSMDQLNTMASGGTFIVMQDLPHDEVYVRHQISTDYEANNLNTAELSITKNVDSISFFFDDLLSPYIGKYNITPELLKTLESVITQGIVSLSSNSYGLYGSQLIYEGTEILLLEQDALLKDHVNCNLKLNVPYPFNHLVLKLFV